MFKGHIKVLCGQHVARGPDVAQAWDRPTANKAVLLDNFHFDLISLKKSNCYFIQIISQIFSCLSLFCIRKQ